MNKYRYLIIGLAAVVLIVVVWLAWFSPAKTIKIGINAPLTGTLSSTGENTRRAAQLWASGINAKGGIKTGGKYHKVELVIMDNQTDPAGAVNVNEKLITEHKVLAIVGPQASSQAVPAGEVADRYATPMISPWSTNPKTTKDRPFVFRACFLDPFQGPVLASFITEEFSYEAAAVLYARDNEYPRGLAKFFKDAWEKLHGKGSVVAYESFNTGDTDFSKQLKTIIKSGAQILFLPQYYNEIGPIVKQARQLGWTRPITGSDSWGASETIRQCGSDCYGFYFCDHFVARGASGSAKQFVDMYRQAYGSLPDGGAALTWDCLELIRTALGNMDYSGSPEKNRHRLRDALAKIEGFEGVTGEMNFNESGDPSKCAMIVKINENGEYEFYKSVCPSYIYFLTSSDDTPGRHS